MKIKSATLTKQLKIGMPNYSNLTVGFSVTAEAEEGEEIDYNALLDTVNQKLGNAVDFDPSWIRNDEFKEHYKLTVKLPKDK